MSEQELKILWEKWIDPYGSNIDESKQWDSFDKHVQKNNEVEDPDDINYQIYKSANNKFDDEEEVDKEDNPFHPKSKLIPMIMTPLGPVPLLEEMLPGKIFNFWIAHTNFSVSNAILKIVDGVPGVEILRPLSKYRFQIAIGKMFDTTEVQKSIEEKIQYEFTRYNREST